MKKLSFIFSLVIIITLNLKSQTLFVPLGLNGIGTTSNNGIGVGTINPVYPFHVISSINNWAFSSENRGCNIYSSYALSTTDGYGMLIKTNNSRSDRYALQLFNSSTLFQVANNGAVGINSTSTGAKLNIKCTWADWIRFENPINSGYWGFHNNSNNTDFQIYRNDGNNNLIWPFHITPNGVVRMNLVGIGTNTIPSDSKLVVDGKITCEEIEVKNVGADFVFDTCYSLMPISELQQFIQTNQHLPGVLPETETKKGVNLGEFNQLLLQKIEELTLYVISLNNENKELKLKLEALENK